MGVVVEKRLRVDFAEESDGLDIVSTVAHVANLGDETCKSLSTVVCIHQQIKVAATVKGNEEEIGFHCEESVEG